MFYGNTGEIAKEFVMTIHLGPITRDWFQASS